MSTHSSITPFFHPHTVTLLAALLCAAACTPKDDGSSEASSGTESAGATEPDPTESAGATEPDPTESAGACSDRDTVDDCCCFELVPSDDENTPARVDVNCPSADLCAGLIVSCGNPEDYQSMTPCDSVSDPAELECALMALADGKPGSLSIDFENTNFPGYWGRTLHLHLRGDGTVYRSIDEFEDLGGQAGGVQHYALQPADVFLDCLAAASVKDQVACLQTAWTGPAIATCTDSSSYSLPGS
jgi:hypothetical protein